MTTNSTLVDQWEDEDENDGEWPYPTQYSKYLIEGDLADRTRNRLGVEDNVPVFLTETVESGGWSEYTQENYYTHTLEVGGFEVDIRGDGYTSSIEELVKWLGEENEA